MSELKKIRVQHVSRGDDGLQIKTDVDVLTDADCITMDGGDLRTGIGGMIDDRIEKLIDGAPEELDTLKEIADEMAENKSGVTTIIKKLGYKADRKDLEDYTRTKDLKTNLADFKDDESHRLVTDVEKDEWNNKVNKVNGKGLSTNDFTDVEKKKLDNLTSGSNTHEATDSNRGYMSAADKSKLDKIEAGAEKNTVTSVNGQTGDVKIDIPRWIYRNMPRRQI